MMPRMAEPETMDVAAEAAAYARADFAEVNAAFVERLLELAGEGGDVRAVDLGCGPGDISVRVAAARPAWEVIGIDASAAMLDFARTAGDGRRSSDGGRLSLVRTDVKRAGLRTGAFAVVFSNSLLHHVTETARLWREVQRLAAPGAVVFFRDLMRPSDDAAARRIVAHYARGESDLLREEFFRSLRSAYTVDEVRTQLATAGLSGLCVEPVTDRHLDVRGRLGDA